MLLTADYILTPEGISSGKAIEFNPDGYVIRLTDNKEKAEHYPGLLIPGLVNTHCHLELSYLKGSIPKRTGMAGFIGELQQIRNNFPEEERLHSAIEAASSMWEKGIQAVGDICNGTDSLSAKETSQIRFLNFIELFGLDPAKAEKQVSRGQDLTGKFGETNSTLVPHAPYSMSGILRDHVLAHTKSCPLPITIHLRESWEEMLLMKEGRGPLADLFRSFGAIIEIDEPMLPEDFFLPELSDQQVLWVHNTEFDEASLKHLLARHPNSYFALCPKANQYIHGTLPDAMLFERIASDVTCIGTDSLAGNDTLDILAELKLLQFQFPQLETATLLQWATVNGAKALKMEQDLGSFEVGKVPGCLQLQHFESDSLSLSVDSVIKRIL